MKKIALLACVAAVAAGAARAADVTVSGLNAPNGALAVDSGTTVLTNGFNATLPSALAAEATLWFAADTNVIADENGGVTEWRDVREAANAETRLYKAALAYLPEEGEAGYEFRSELPVLVTTNKLSRPGAKVVDFGSYGSGRWLYFAAPGSTDRLRVNIGSFFTVIGFDSTCGHILGDVSALTNGASGAMYFHKGMGSQTGGNIATGTEANSTMHLGETRLNGTRIDPRIVPYNYNAFQLFSQNGPDNPSRGRPYASTFFNNANFKASNGGTMTRQGGGAVAEFIAFARVLSDAERREVEAYLAAKYFGVPVAGRVAVADGATLATGLDGTWGTYDRVAVLSDSCGAGTIRKSGAGSLLLERPVSVDASRIDLVNGHFGFGQMHLAPFVAPAVNRHLTIGTWYWQYSHERTDGRLALQGTGAPDAAASFAPVDWAGQSFVVKDAIGILRNRPVPYTPPALGFAETNLLVNGGFEQPVVPGSNAYQSGVPTGWTRNVSGSGGTAVAQYGCVWRTTTADKVEGNQCLALTGNGATLGDLQQTFTAPFDGLYRLTFWAGRRESRSETEGQLRMYVCLDGQDIALHVNCADHRGNRNAMRQFLVHLPPLAKGPHTIGFRMGTNVTTDRSVILDDVQLSPVAQGEFVSVPNAGFESVEMITTSGSNGYFKGAPQEATWSFISTYTNLVDNGDGTVTTNVSNSGSSCGICGSSTWFAYHRSVPAPGEELENLHKAYMQGHGKIVTTVTAPRAGAVVFTMRYGNRANMSWDWTSIGNVRTTGHTCRVLLDGVEIGSVTPTCEAVRTFISVPFAIAAGEHMLEIENVPPASGDVATVVDDIRIAYDDSGLFALGETFTATLTAPSNGFYRLTVPAIGTELQLGHINGSCNGFARYPATAYLYLDGTLTSKIRVERPEWTSFAFVLPYLTAGDHTLAFSLSSNGLETASDARFRVGHLDLQPLAFLETAPADAMKDTSIEVVDAAKLDLQFEGKMTLGKLRIDGTSVTGEFSAASDPTHFTGPGVLVVHPKGTMVIIR
jgi:hypothetical protein